MSDTATIRAAPRAGARVPAAGVQVSDYVGQPAAEAARALRRVGLRPGLDRSLGCEPALTGLVVAQEPPDGEQLPRNGMVTLYVAAPGAQGEQVDEHERLAAPERVQMPPAADTGAGLVPGRRTRKRGRARGREQASFETPPEPRLRPSDEYTWETPGPADPEAGEQSDQHDLQPEPPAETGGLRLRPEPEPEPSLETLLAEELFAGRAGERWPRPHLLRGSSPRWATALAWVRRHPVLATSVVAMLAVWAAVAGAGRLASPRAHSAPNTAQSSLRATGTAPPGRPVERSAATLARRRADVKATTETDSARRGPHRGTLRPIAAAAAPTHPPDIPTQGEAQRIPAHEVEPSHTSAQSGGGPFSP